MENCKNEVKMKDLEMIVEDYQELFNSMEGKIHKILYKIGEIKYCDTEDLDNFEKVSTENEPRQPFIPTINEIKYKFKILDDKLGLCYSQLNEII